jgi:hypothetical protein
MLSRCIFLFVSLLVLAGLTNKAAAEHERWYEFEGTHFALSIERVAGLEYLDFEGPGGGELTARVLLNASERVPTSSARFGFDVFIHRFSIGAAGGFTNKDVGIIAPRVGYLFGLTPQLGLWLRGGAFYAAAGGAQYFGPYGEVLLGWFPIPQFALTFGPTFDFGVANANNRDYIQLGILSLGMTVFL